MSQVAAMGTSSAEPVEYSLTDSLGKLGMWLFLAGDAMGFGALIAGYGALRLYSANWPNPAEVLGIGLTAFMTFVLICSSVTMVKALSAIRDGNLPRFRLFLAGTIFGGAVFLGLQAYEWTHLMRHEGVWFSTNPHGSALFGSTFFAMTGFHGMHVTGGVIYLLTLLIRSFFGKYSAGHSHPIEIAGLYWHFVDLVWILIFTFVYLL